MLMDVHAATVLRIAALHLCAVAHFVTRVHPEINVETFQGRVQLSGFVNFQADINRTVTLTRTMAGVKSVSNDMKLK
jgi:hypothetical protein